MYIYIYIYIYVYRQREREGEKIEKKKSNPKVINLLRKDNVKMCQF